MEEMAKQFAFTVIPRDVVEKLYRLKDAIESQEKAFRVLGKGDAWVLPIIHHDVTKHSGHLEIKPGVVGTPPLFGLKLISVYPSNAKIHVSPMQAVVMINDAKTGIPVAIVDGVTLTNLRTAAAGAVGAKYLARRNSTRVGVLGTGTQGRLQVLALNEVFKLESVKAWSREPANRRGYERRLSGELGISVRAMDSAEDCVRDVDILVTATPSKEPLVRKEWVGEGTHINVIGADRKGKQELDLGIYDGAKVCVDKREIALEKGLIKSHQIYAELGEVVAGLKKGRENDQEITVFDSSGIGVQDIVAAEMIYRKARARRLGYSSRLF